MMHKGRTLPVRWTEDTLTNPRTANDDRADITGDPRSAAAAAAAVVDVDVVL